jgi:hypothetical protein
MTIGRSARGPRVALAIAYTTPSSRVPTNSVPFGDSVIDRAPGTSAA